MNLFNEEKEKMILISYFSIKLCCKVLILLLSVRVLL
ncbi:hypothetical membrane protein [Bacteroides ovatus V975]|uniref:Uncharacterized protein n=1 Tax=Bacteroides ovatus (strain ATCC 8483 / DSM 1896 / JCM 5824 / BCRC 10623 / CCUG 4943 / NCTC 11153) TaxID=411476 RepID=A0AAN3D417_BACO1|nr:hypothetical protein BACOVA_05331 [Bacteroides ovatus ATCC 8483]SCV08749.1 hypothetical membrane protein [Bacteroides ovatus V975]